MSEPTQAEIDNLKGTDGFDYTALNGCELLKILSDDARQWATAFVQHAKKVEARGENPLDEGWLTTWFANAIEHSSDVRRWRAEPQTRPVLSHPLTQ